MCVYIIITHTIACAHACSIAISGRDLTHAEEHTAALASTVCACCCSVRDHVSGCDLRWQAGDINLGLSTFAKCYITLASSRLSTSVLQPVYSTHKRIVHIHKAHAWSMVCCTMRMLIPCTQHSHMTRVNLQMTHTNTRATSVKQANGRAEDAPCQLHQPLLAARPHFLGVV